VALAPTAALTSGSYYGAIQDSTTGCESAVRLIIEVNVNGEVAAFINESKSPCVFDEIIYTTEEGMSNYNWTVSGGEIVEGGLTTDNFITVRWLEYGQESIGVSYSNLCNVIKSKTLDIVIAACSDLTITSTVSNRTPQRNEEVTFTITVNNIGTGSFIDLVVGEILPNGYSFVSAYTDTNSYNSTTGIWNISKLDGGQSVILTVVAQVLEVENYLYTASILFSNPSDPDVNNNYTEVFVTPICLVVYNMFTPNNDGLNDFFKIDCIENYPNNKLSVYNRYGNLVFAKENYNNDWQGMANVAGVVNKGDKLPMGTYYYVIDFGTAEKTKSGWLSIVR
jgi:gliding motility-associated-like protein/uncharacterized repeat protein (TIGR01451 family)